jgi:hypothetical protein
MNLLFCIVWPTFNPRIALKDEICLDRDNSSCRVSTAGPAHYLEYHFYVRSDDDFDIWVRAAAQYPGNKMRMEIHPVGQDKYSKAFEVIGNGLESFKDIVWENLYLEENEYKLRIYLNDYQTVCSVVVKDSTSRHIVHVPGTYSATFYADSREFTKEVYGNCPYVNDLYSGVDALAVDDDPECAAAMSEHDVTCAVGWTESSEMMTYRFKTDGIHQVINLSFRVASRSKNRRMLVELFSTDPFEFIIEGPGKGWDHYETITWENVYIGSIIYHDIYVTFLDGQMNLCSFGIDYVDL